MCIRDRVSAATVSLFPQTVMASGVSDVTQPLMNLKTLVISIIGAVGAVSYTHLDVYKRQVIW